MGKENRARRPRRIRYLSANPLRTSSNTGWLGGTTLKDEELIKVIVNATASLAGLDVVPLEQRDRVKALELMDKHGLDYEDSLHLAVALRTRARKIISNDKDFDKAPREHSNSKARRISRPSFSED